MSLVVAVLLVGTLGLTGCHRTNWIHCESGCWPGPRIGPTSRCLCPEPTVEGPCPPREEPTLDHPPLIGR